MIEKTDFSTEENRLLREPYSKAGRPPFHERMQFDCVIVGGGLAGVCAAITAARCGIRVALIQDRSVLGGNASSEVRLWVLGATSHMGNNNRWSRESGVIGEILLENLYRNPEGNPLLVDTLLVEKVSEEENIQLFLNTAVHEVEKAGDSRIKSVRGWCSQNGTAYTFEAPVFMDASGDGIVSFLSGAAFRMGAETSEEFGERLAPDEEFGFLLGNSLYFYSKDTGKPVEFHAPSFALKDISKIPRYKMISLEKFGCNLWWIEYGGRHDTVRDAEEIKWNLWKIIYGVWDYIKNSGKFPDSETHTLEWVGMIPGKRESRRFEGQYMLKQQDVVEQVSFEDSVAFGGWSLDLHPADGVYTSKPGCTQWHSRGIYEIPLRVALSRDIKNLLYAGRIISASHVAFGSTRVMGTCAYLAQAVAVTAVEMVRRRADNRSVAKGDALRNIRTRLHGMGQHIPNVPAEDPADLIREAELSASSEYALREVPADGPGTGLNESAALLVPARKGKVPALEFSAGSEGATTLTVQLRVSERPGNYTPDVVLEEREITLPGGRHDFRVAFESQLARDDYAFICFLRNEAVTLADSLHRVTGVLSVYNGKNEAVSNTGMQSPGGEIGVDAFEFWCPRRRPAGRLIAFSAERPLYEYTVGELKSGYFRPTTGPNAWAASLSDRSPALDIRWEESRSLEKLIFHLDPDFDHAMESVLVSHPERVIPFVLRDFKVLDEEGETLFSVRDNHQGRVELVPERPVATRSLRIVCEHPSRHVPAAIFAVQAYGSRENGGSS